jgi:hypothetical protein
MTLPLAARSSHVIAAALLLIAGFPARAQVLEVTQVEKVAPPSASPEEVAGLLGHGDAAWDHRADGARGGQAAPEAIGEAVRAYQKVIHEQPTHLEAHWKLMRALWFEGEYATTGEEARKAVFGRGREVGDAAFALLRKATGRDLTKAEPSEVAASLRGVPTLLADAVPTYFWAAVNWGLWGEAFGKLAAARQGVAGRIRDYTQVVIALDETYELAGGHRVLGRLHDRAPHIPFITGWVSQDTALVELRRAVALAPDSSFNRLYLAEALASAGGAANKAEAKRLLGEVTTMPAAGDGAVERAHNVEVARRLLATP